MTTVTERIQALTCELNASLTGSTGDGFEPQGMYLTRRKSNGDFHGPPVLFMWIVSCICD